MNLLQFEVLGQTLTFQPVEMTFVGTDIENVFAAKNNKTLHQTILSPRYARLTEEIQSGYSDYLNYRLGDFIQQLKLNGDDFYKYFLNAYGDGMYCHFTISEHHDKKGLYLYQLDGHVNYVGRCRDSFGKRFRYGYGRISPKNCYIDGQPTNCRLNSLINIHRDTVSLYICSMQENDLIERCERELIKQLQPEWNRALK